MEIFDLLLVCIEVSIALAGFAGIISSFQTRDITKIRRGNVAGLTVIVQFSLLAALVCAVPILLNTFVINYETIWLISSVFTSIVLAGGAYGCMKKMSIVIAKKSFTRFIFALLQGMGYLVALAIILNAADLVFHREPGPLIAGVFYALFVAGYMFSRLLLHPLWRIVDEQEAALLE